MEDNNKKTFYITWNKKIVSVSVLALALFMLLSVSYAFFTTKVEGNEEAKTTRLTTATETLKLDGTTITSLENATPGHSNDIKFTVTNTGTADTEYDLDIINVINTFADKTDLVYTITSADGGGKKETETQAPSSSGHLIQKITIKAGATHNYTMTLTFKETNNDQNDNQGKMFSGKIQINNTEDTELAAKIISANPIRNEVPDFSKSYPNKTDNDTTLSGLYSAEDDDGPSFYFRGKVDNNNVHFADLDWKILRINGDGSIRLIISSELFTAGLNQILYSDVSNDLKYAGYTFDNTKVCTKSTPCISEYKNENFTNDYGGTDSNVKEEVEDWYKRKLAKYDDRISLTTYCNDTSIVDINAGNSYYGPYQRIEIEHQPMLKCPNPTIYSSTDDYNTYGGVYKLKVGAATVDELVLAGIARDDNVSNNHYLSSILYTFNWTMSPTSSACSGEGKDSLACVYWTQGTQLDYINTDFTSMGVIVTPVISLKPDVVFSVNKNNPGTVDNPYVIQ